MSRRSRRSSAVKNATLFLLPFIAIGGAAWWFFAALMPVDRSQKDTVIFSIPKASGVRDIGHALAEKKLIKNEYAFEVAVAMAGLTKDLQAGAYDLSPSMSATAIARTISRSGNPKEVVLTIPEGWTAKQIGTYLEQKGVGTAAEFTAAASAADSRTVLPDERFDFLVVRPAGATLEGYLFPDTYRVFPNATTSDVIKKMLNNFSLKVSTDLRGEITQQGKTLYDVVTLASIVEREVRSDQDRKTVADIFLRRLSIGMALQSDATVNYATGKSALQPTLTDLEVVSPYNTYAHPGLPPGPIGNPGLSSIAAVVRPQANAYLYFLTDESGAVHYATTYEEHLSNKQRYLK